MNKIGSKKALFLLNNRVVEGLNSIVRLGYNIDDNRLLYKRVLNKIFYKKKLKYLKKKKIVIKSNFYLMLRYSVNNIYVSIYNEKGEVFFNKTGGVGNKGTRKYTVTTAEQLGRDLAVSLNKLYISKFMLVLKSPVNKFIYAVLRGLGSGGIFNKFFKTKRLTGILVRISKAHNGVRRRKLRRV